MSTANFKRSTIELIRGRTQSFDVLANRDVTGKTIRCVAKRDLADVDGDAVFSKTTANGIVVTDNSTGAMTITINPANTSTLPNRRVRLYYEVLVVDGTERYPVDWGEVVVNPNVYSG